MRRFLCDTNVLVYALGAEHPYREACRSILGAQAEEALAGEVSTVVVAEFAHQRLRQTDDRAEAALRARQVAAAFRIHPVTEAEVELALGIYERARTLDAFDSLLAATALNQGVEAVVSADRAFDEVAGLERVDPLDRVAIGALAR